MTDIFYVNNNFKNVTLTKHFHEEYTISLVYEGAHIFGNESDKYKVLPGIIQTINPYEIHSTTNSSWSHINIMPSVELINSIASTILQKEVFGGIRINTIIDDVKASKLFYNLFASFDVKKENRLLVDSNLVEFLDYILRKHSSIKQEEIKDIKCEKLNDSLEYINANLSNENLSLEDISFNVGISKYHFLREFKKEFGLTPNQYIQIKKVNKARELLKKDVSLSSIAYDCGFTDQSYMIKVFKKYIGYTPSKLQIL